MAIKKYFNTPIIISVVMNILALVILGSILWPGSTDGYVELGDSLLLYASIMSVFAVVAAIFAGIGISRIAKKRIGVISLLLGIVVASIPGLYVIDFMLTFHF
jgi:hypothetical protein